jgi:hypothetical protein
VLPAQTQAWADGDAHRRIALASQRGLDRIVHLDDFRRIDD